jgi:hypothetical protein
MDATSAKKGARCKRGGTGGSLGKSRISGTLHRGGHFGNFSLIPGGMGGLASEAASRSRFSYE